MSDDGIYDLLVVGGGINGACIARDAAGRGLKVMLVEQDDLASHTSSASTKLIHGGLRYLERLDFRLVRESLIERERLLAIAPHLVRPLDFVIRRQGSPRPAWLVRLGLLIYDHVGGPSSLPRTRTVALAEDGLGSGLAARVGKAFVYSDCVVDDSRLVVLNALDAAERGARICTRTRLVNARRDGEIWVATLGDGSGETKVRARALVNAAGPWAAELRDRLGVQGPVHKVRLVKGSHIVVPRLYDGPHAHLIQNPDGRVVFAIPFEGFTLVGTTDVAWDGPPAPVAISDAEVAYLLDTIGRVFAAKVSRSDVRWSFSGIRPLLDDGRNNPSKVTRDYVLELEASGPPLLSVIGGKLTTSRRLAEHVLARLAPWFDQAKRPWTARSVLPGGALPAGFVSFEKSLHERYPFLEAGHVHRLARSYGDRAARLLGDATSLTGLGEAFGGGLYQREVDYLIAEEWAHTAEDILYRRSKLGLHLSPASAARLQDYVAERVSARQRRDSHAA